MSRLIQDQQDFFDFFVEWGVEARRRGYKCTFGDAYRDPRASFPYSSPGTVHDDRLAVDVNLFKAGQWLTTKDEWREMGKCWDSLDPRCSWGGDLSDPNHLSFNEGKDHVVA